MNNSKEKEIIFKYILNNQNPYSNLNNLKSNYEYGSGKRIRSILNILKEDFEINFVVEVGSLYGNSAITIRDILNNVTILCVDTFLGDVNIRLRIDKKGNDRDWNMKYNGFMPIMINQFLTNIIATNNTEYIFPFMISSIVGLKSIKRLIKFKNLKNPDLIYLDSSHEEGETYLEIKHSWDLLGSNTILLGDDYNWKGVKNDVNKFSKLFSNEFKKNDKLDKNSKIVNINNLYLFPKNRPVVWLFIKK